MEYFLLALKKYADFTGRARRKEYWMFILFYVISVVVLSVVEGFIGLTGVLSGIFMLVLLVPSLSAAARRLHDTGRTGWWQLVAIIPIIGTIILIVLLALDSHDDNNYGPNPKAA